jgi:uncharacterized UBP type Zn finger protein
LQFAGTEQFDAAEFIQMLLEMIDSEAKQAGFDRFPSEYFTGVSRNTVECLTCGFRS